MLEGLTVIRDASIVLPKFFGELRFFPVDPAISAAISR